MSNMEQEKIEWRKFYEIKDELWSLISRETTELDDSSSKLSRWICLTTDEELLKKIENLIKKLNKQYKIAAKEKGDYKYTPVILRNVENIIINSYDSYSSYRIEKGTRISAIGVIRVSKISMLENFWRKDYNKNIKKYKLIENKIERKIIYTSDSLKIMSFTKELKENNIKASSKIIDLKIVPGIEEFNKKLNLNKNSKLIFMKRVRYANDSPMTIEENYFPYDRFKGLLEEKIEGSLYELLEKKYNTIPTRSSRQEIEIVKSDEEQSKLLNVPTFEPLFYFSGITYDENDIPIHIAKRYIIGSKYKFIV